MDNYQYNPITGNLDIVGVSSEKLKQILSTLTEPLVFAGTVIVLDNGGQEANTIAVHSVNNELTFTGPITPDETLLSAVKCDPGWVWLVVTGGLSHELGQLNVGDNILIVSPTDGEGLHAEVLTDIVPIGYQLIGVADLTTNDNDIDVNVKCAWLAATAGTYTGLGNVVVGANEIAVITRVPSGGSVVYSTIILSKYAKTAQLGYLECSTAGGIAAKTISDKDFILSPTISLKVKFANKNTSNGSVTLNIDLTGAVPLYYQGAAVSASNTWETGEVCEVYYDGTNYYANPIEQSFKTGEKLNNVSIVNDHTTGGEHDVLSAEQGKTLANKLNIFDYSQINKTLGVNATTWSNGNGLMIKIKPQFKTVYIEAPATAYKAVYAFLTSNDLSQNPAFVSNESQSLSIDYGSSQTLDIPLDAKYIFVALGNRTPLSLKIYGYNFDSAGCFNAVDFLIDLTSEIINDKISDINDDIEDINDDIEDINDEIYNLKAGAWILPLVEQTQNYLNKNNGSIEVETTANRWKLNKYNVFNLIGNVSGTSTSDTATATWALYKNGVCVKFGSEGNVDFNEYLDGYSYDTLYVQLRSPDLTADVSFIDKSNALISQNGRDIDSLQLLNPMPKILLPQKVYAVVGTEINLYYDACITCLNKDLAGFNVEVLCDVGRAYQYGFQYTPVAGDVGTHTLTIAVYSNDHQKLIEKSISLIVIAATGLSSAKNILMIGDSTLDNPHVTPTVGADFVALGGTTPSFVGSKGTAPYKNCGYSGRTFNSFTSSGYTYYTFAVTGVEELAIGAYYSDGTSVYRIVEINVNNGVGYINTSLVSGSGESSASGTLDKTSGAGDASITYDGITTSPSNPLWNENTNQLDIAMYKTNIELTGEFDLVSIRLGVNDTIKNFVLTQAQIEEIGGKAETLVAAFLAEYASTKVVVELPTTCGNTRNGFATNYGASQNYNVYLFNISRLIEELIETFDAGAYNDNVTVCATGMCVDRSYGFPTKTIQVASRIDKTIEIQSNGVHPNQSGYHQIADCEFAHYLHELSE